MRKIIPLIFSMFSSLALIGQADGGWGNCEFATVAAMNAFDPSTSNFACKKVFVQATDEHYRWNGTAWVLESSDVENIYTTDDELEGDRTVDLNTHDLTFDGTSDVVIQSDGDVGIGVTPTTALDVDGIGLFRNGETWSGGGNGQLQFGYNSANTYRHSIKSRHHSGGVYNGLDFFVWQPSDDINDLGTLQIMSLSSRNSGSVGVGTLSPNAKFEVNGGNVRFTNYGSGTYDDASPTRLLGVDLDGDVVEVELGADGLKDNIYNIDGELEEDRTVDLNTHDLTFDGTSDVVIQSDGDVGIGVTPTTEFDVSGTGLFRNGSGWNNSGNVGQLQFGFNNTNTYRHSIKTRHNNGNNNYNGIDFFVWEQGVDALGDLGTRRAMTVSAANSGSVGIGIGAPAAKLHVDGGNVRLSSYGTPTTYDGSPIKILGVEGDGDIVQTTLADIGGNENIYTIDGELEEDRTVDLNTHDLTFDGTSDVVIQSDGDVGIGVTPTTEFDVSGTGLFRNGSGWNNSGNVGQLQFGFNNTNTYRHSIKTRHNNGNNNYNGIDFFVWEQGVDALGDLGTRRAMTVSAANSGSVGIGIGAPAAKLHVDGGNVRLSSYGTPTTYDGSPIKILGVEGDGDIVQTTLADIGGNENIYTIDGELEEDRTVDLNTHDLTFDGTSDVVIQSDGDVGIGVTPTTEFDVSGTGLFRNGSGWNNSGNVGQLQFGFNNTNTYRHSIKTRHNDSNNNYNGIDFFVWEQGVDALGDLGTRRAMTVSAANSGSVGIGNGAPSAKLHITETGTGTPASAASGTILLEHTTAGGSSSIVFESAQNSGSDYGYIEYTDDGSGNGTSSENSLLEIGVQNDGTNAHQDDIAIMPSGSLGIGTTSPAARLDVDGGGVRLSDYGTPTTYDEASPLKILGVEADGDVVQTSAASFINTDDQIASEVTFTPAGTIAATDVQAAIEEVASESLENIYNTDDELTSDRVVDLNTNDLTFDGSGTGDVIIKEDGKVGIGNIAPGAQLEVTFDRNAAFTVAEPDDGVNTFLSPLAGVNENATSWSRSLTALTPNIADGDVAGLLTFGQGDAPGQAGHIYFVDTGADGEEYIGFGMRSVGWNFLNITGAGDVGVGTFTPDAKFDVEGGNVRFSDYGEGTYIDTAAVADPADATYALAVDTNGDVVEVNTAKSSKIFYPPALVIDVSSAGDNRTLDLHQEYVARYGTPAIVSSGAPTAIPTYGETELFYYVTDYDTGVFSDLEISEEGILTYDVDVVPSNNCAVFNVVFVVK